MASLLQPRPTKIKLKGKSKLLFISLIVIINESATVIMLTSITGSAYNFQLLNQFDLLQIIFCGILSYPILLYQLYCHHFLSIALLFVGFGFISFDNFANFSPWTILISIFFCYLHWSLAMVMSKWIMEFLSISAFQLCFLFNAIHLTLLVVLIPVLMFIPCDLSFCSEGGVEPFVSSFASIFSSGPVLLNLILYFLYALLSNLGSEKMSPAHVSMADILTNIILWIYFMPKDSIDSYFAYYLTGYAFIMLGALVYNQFIIFGFCGLDEFTKL